MEANVGARSTSCSRWPAARSSTQSLAALAPFGRCVDLRDRLARAQRGHDAARSCAARSAVVGFWLMHCLGRPDDGRRGARRPLRARARGELRVVVGAHLRALRTRRSAQIDLRRAAHHRQAAAGPAASPSPYDHLRRPRPLRAPARGAARRRLRVAEPDPGAGHPAAARGPRRDRPGPDRHRQDGRLRPADARVRRPRGRRGPGARAHARRASCASRSRRRSAPTAHARASTSSPSSAARRSAPSRPSCARAGRSSSAPSGACWTSSRATR